MTELTWGNPGDKVYQTGLKRGVLYAQGEDPVAWNGLVSLTENVSGGEVESYYYDGNKYLDWILYEDFQATLEAFNTPVEWGLCDGYAPLGQGLYVTQQLRRPFGLSWRTSIGNDLTEDAGYLLHILWGCTASPAEKVSSTKSNDTTLPTKSWVINSAPPPKGTYGGLTYKPTAHMILDSRAGSAQLIGLEQGLYGDTVNDPFLPTQQQVMNMMNTGFW